MTFVDLWKKIYTNSESSSILIGFPKMVYKPREEKKAADAENNLQKNNLTVEDGKITFSPEEVGLKSCPLSDEIIEKLHEEADALRGTY